MPIGYLVTVVLLAWCTAFALAPPMPSRSSPSNPAFWFGFLVNELPFAGLFVLVASTVLAVADSDLTSPVALLAFGLATATAVGLVVIARRGLRAGPATDRALTDGLGDGWRATIDSARGGRRPRHLPWARIVLAPIPLGRRDVERIKNLAYGDAGRQNRLDVYRPRSDAPGGPVLIHFHGGAFRHGGKSRESRPLLQRLASRGWVCISANYRLSPGATFPDPLIDAKRVIAWAREHGHDYGADPSMVFVAGSSAGGHLAAMAALTPNEPRLQPGFERADTSVTAAISLYGYSGSVDTRDGSASSPIECDATHAPPFFVAHGDQDTLVLVDDARRFVEGLRSNSSAPVVYAELPRAQHGFDRFHSIRSDTIVDGIEAFVTWVRAHWNASDQR